MLSAPELSGSRAFQVIWCFSIKTLKRRGTAERITRFSSNEDNSLSSEILSEAFLTRDEVLLFLKFKKRSRLWRNRIRCFLRGNLVEKNLRSSLILLYEQGKKVALLWLFLKFNLRLKKCESHVEVATFAFLLLVSCLVESRSIIETKEL